MGSITKDLADLLGAVERPGHFHASGREVIPAPGLAVAPLGPIALPLLPAQAEALIAQAEPAPYGRGQETVVDTDVRRCWQIDADKVRFSGRHWPDALARIVGRVGAELGVREPVEAELYKLLIYDAGGFFVPHRDTEKTAGMFATLVIALPSVYAGGALVVQHQGETVRLDLRCPDPAEAAFAAFYADCRHEVEPVTEGCRLVLVYNLIRRGRGPRPLPPDHRPAVKRLVARLNAWAPAIAAGHESCAKVIHPLEHVYTPAELGFTALKGVDAARGQVLQAAASVSECDLHLALLSITETGAAEIATGDYPRRRWEDPDDYDMVEVFDRWVELTNWQHSDGDAFPLEALAVAEEDLSPPGILDDLAPDEQELHEATGNEGVTMERTYSRTALVLWPRSQRHAVLASAGVEAVLPLIEVYVERWIGAGAATEDANWQEAHALAGALLPSLGRSANRPGARHGDPIRRMLAVLTRMQDRALIEDMMVRVVARGHLSGEHVDALGAAWAVLPRAMAATLVERIIAGNGGRNTTACARLLARAASDTALAGDPEVLRPAAQALLVALAGNGAGGDDVDDPLDSAYDGFEAGRLRPRRLEPLVVADSLIGLGTIAPALADQAVTLMLDRPVPFGLDALMIPGLVRLKDRPAVWALPAVQRLRTVCLAHLIRRMAEDLTPPRDWRRAADLGCDCPDCADLARFLADPEAETWVFKAAASYRSHVETVIRNSGCDLSCKTVRQGRPHRLVCTKTLGSHERRMAQHRQDQACFAILEAMAPGDSDVSQAD